MRKASSWSVGVVVVMVTVGVAWAKPSGDHGHKKKGCDATSAACPSVEADSPKPKKEKGSEAEDSSTKGPKTSEKKVKRSCDDEVVTQALAAIDERCPCEGRTDDAGDLHPWRNHGRYVACVTRARRRVLRELADLLPRRCLRRVVRCASRSTCGRREGVVTCSTPEVTCDDGVCSNDSMATCETAEDCGGGETQCSIASSAEVCEERGRVAGMGSCCDPMPLGSPSGAFVDGSPSF